MSRPRASGAPAGTPRWLSPGEPPAANKYKERRKKRKKTWPWISMARISPQAQITFVCFVWQQMEHKPDFGHPNSLLRSFHHKIWASCRKYCSFSGKNQCLWGKSSINMWILFFIPFKQQRGACECNNLILVCRDSYAKYQYGPPNKLYNDYKTSKFESVEQTDTNCNLRV